MATMNHSEQLVFDKNADSVFSKLIDETIIVIDAALPSSHHEKHPVIREVTKTTCRLLKYKESELIGKPLAEIFSSQSEISELMNVTKKSGQTYQTEQALRTKNGNDLAVMFTCLPRYNSKNKLSGVLLFGQDITGRKIAEDTMTDKKELFQSILENMVNGIALSDEKGELIFFNPSAEKILGKGLTKTIPENLSACYGLFMPDKKTLFPVQFLPLMRAVKGETVDQCEMYVKPDKESGGVFIHVNAKPIRDESNKIKGAVAVFNDITASKKAQEKLRESEERFRTLIDASFEDILLYDKGKIIDANNSAAKYFGYTISEMIGMSIIDLIAEESKSAIRKKLVRVIKKPRIDIGVFDTHCVRKDGTRFIAEVYGRGIGFQDKLVRVITFRDITAKKEAEETLEQHFEFENLITGISTKFINLEPDEIDDGILEALEKIGEFSKVDRSYVAIIGDDGNTVYPRGEWCARGIKSLRTQIKQTKIANMQHFIQQLQNKNPIYVPRVKDLPDDAGVEKQWLEKGGIKSVVVVPMVLGESLL